MSKYTNSSKEELIALQQKLMFDRSELRKECLLVQRELDHRAIEAAASKAAGRPINIARA